MTANRCFRIPLAGACALTLLLMLLGFAPGAKAAFHLGDRHALRLAVASRVAVTHRAWAKADPDHDGLGNWVEIHRYRTDPHRFDTDGDGYGDGLEVRDGTDPRSAASTPSSPPASAPSGSSGSGSSPSSPPVSTPPVSTPVESTPPPNGDPGTEPPVTSPPGSPPSEPNPPPSKHHSGSGDHHPGTGEGHKPPTEAPTSPEEEAPSAPEEGTETPEEGPASPEEGPETPEEGPTTPEEGPATPPVDTTPPQTTIGSGPSATTATGAASFTFSSSEVGSTFECRLDGAEWAACSSPQSYTALAAGAHSFAVMAVDAADNVDPTPATWSWTVTAAPESGGGSTGSVPCTQTVSAGANVSTAISGAAAGSVVCLPSGATSFSLSQVNKSSLVTVRGTGGTVGYSAIRRSSNLRFEGIRFTDGLELLGATSGIQIVDNEFTGNFGIHAGGEAHTISGSKVSDVLIEGNYIHDTNYTGSQGTANGYGITASDGVANFTIRGNTIKSPASDYIQSASPVNFIVDHNTFLGPSLLGTHEDHQDLWQIFGGGTNIAFTNNVARDTETQESLLFQEGTFQNVVIENNLFDHDSRGYTCQIYQSKGLIFRDNTIVGSHWGCLFRDLASAPAGSGYAVDHNVFVGTAEGADISTEGRAASWGAYDYNVSEDGSASGTHSIRDWKPTWADLTNYVPSGLPFEAGYRP